MFLCVCCWVTFLQATEKYRVAVVDEFYLFRRSLLNKLALPAEILLCLSCCRCFIGGLGARQGMSRMNLVQFTVVRDRRLNESWYCRRIESGVIRIQMTHIHVVRHQQESFGKKKLASWLFGIL